MGSKLYQTFSDQKGISDSFEKLEALRLPVDMTGKSFLDLGCNEGFFCGEAVRRGALKVVGYELNPMFFCRAKERFPGIDFRNASWWAISEERFDIILFSSTLHYEQKPREFLEFLGKRLTDDGVLVLECGIADGDHLLTHGWRSKGRQDGNWPYPTFALLRDRLLERFAVRYIGPSVSPPISDGPPRHVFHCKVLRPTVLLLTGESGSGKSSLSDRLNRQTIAVLHTDHVMELALRTEPESSSVFAKNYSRNFSERFSLEYINCCESLAEQFAAFIESFLVTEIDVTAVEGGVFIYDGIREGVVERLTSSGYKVWYASPAEGRSLKLENVNKIKTPADYDGRSENGYAGRIDGIYDRTLIGWCCQIASTEFVEVELLIDGVVVGVYRARSKRNDLERRGFETGKYGLYIDLSEFSYKDESIFVLRTLDKKFICSGSNSRAKDLRIDWLDVD